MNDGMQAVNEELQRKGYFVLRHSQMLSPRQIVTDITPLEGHKVVIVGPASPEDIEEFEATHRRCFPLGETKRQRQLKHYPYVYRAIAE